MSRFLIRNYGPSRQIAYREQQICLSNDQCIETDDEEMSAVLGAEKSIHVTDRGIEAANPISSEESMEKERKVTVDDPEAVHEEIFPDEDSKEQPIEDQQVGSDEVEESDEITYDDMTVKELQVLCKDRGIKTSGLKKGEIIEALEEYDKEG